MAHDRASVLGHLPTHDPHVAQALTAHADALAAAGLPWQTILQLILQLLAGLGPLVKPPATP